MSPRHYAYVGPGEILVTVAAAPAGAPIAFVDDLAAWLGRHADDVDPDGTLTATFVVTLDGELSLAPRRSEHVACAAGGPVLSAGEMTFSAGGAVVQVTNQSTGFCPEPESWPQVAAALDRIGLTHPGRFTTALLFRRCPACGERNIVKDGWFACDVCGGELPAEWNFD